MNKKGMTVVELIVSFSLTTVIALFLIQVVIFLRDAYITSGIKSEMILKQSIISDRINSIINDQEIVSINKNCGANCIEMTLNDNKVSSINFDKASNRVIIDDYVANLVNGSKINEVNIYIEKIGTESNINNNDSILVINANITNDLIIDESFDINVLYQFNSEKTNLSLN